MIMKLTLGARRPRIAAFVIAAHPRDDAQNNANACKRSPATCDDAQRFYAPKNCDAASSHVNSRLLWRSLNIWRCSSRSCISAATCAHERAHSRRAPMRADDASRRGEAKRRRRRRAAAGGGGGRRPFCLQHAPPLICMQLRARASLHEQQQRHRAFSRLTLARSHSRWPRAHAK